MHVMTCGLRKTGLPGCGAVHSSQGEAAAATADSRVVAAAAAAAADVAVAVGATGSGFAAVVVVVVVVVVGRAGSCSCGGTGSMFVCLSCAINIMAMTDEAASTHCAASELYERCAHKRTQVRFLPAAIYQTKTKHTTTRT